VILRGRPIAPGRGRGRVLVSRSPLSFLGGIDGTTGRVVDTEADIRGRRLKDRVLAFPHGTGSTVGSYVLYGLAKRRVGPSALVAERAETVVATGAILGKIPMVDRVDTMALRTGDVAVVDGTRGTVSVPAVKEIPVATAFLHHRGQILFVRRSRLVGSFRGRWSGISGYIERSENPLTRARREVAEETGVQRARLLATGRPLSARHAQVVYQVHPFLFDAPSRKVRLDWENVEARWLKPGAAASLPTVPRLRDALEAVLQSGEHPTSPS